MHAFARERLQTYLYSYKESPKEKGLEVMFDGRTNHWGRKEQAERHALHCLREVSKCRVAFAVKTHIAYDGSLEYNCPLYRKAVSFTANSFIHIYGRYNKDWWLGRLVASESTIGFVPTARRLSRLRQQQNEEESQRTPRMAILWEYSRPYTVVPSTRPIILLGPSSQNCRLTQLMHAAIRTELLSHFGDRMISLKTNIGNRENDRRAFNRSMSNQAPAPSSSNENELRLVTKIANELRFVLLETPNIEMPADLTGIDLAPILILFRIRNRKILLKLIKQTGHLTKSSPDVIAAETLNVLGENEVDLVIENNDLNEATRKIRNYLEEYWAAIHPTTPLVEDIYIMGRRQSVC